MKLLLALLILIELIGSVFTSGCHVVQGVINGEILPHPTPQVNYSYNDSTKRIIIDVIVPYDPASAIIIDFSPFDRKRQSLEEYTTCENRSAEAFPDGWKLEEFLGTIADTNNFGDKVNPMYPQTGGAGMWRRRVIDCATVAYTLDAYLSDILRACGGKIITAEGNDKGKAQLTLFVTYATPVNDKYVNGVSVLSMSLNDVGYNDENDNSLYVDGATETRTEKANSTDSTKNPGSNGTGTTQGSQGEKEEEDNDISEEIPEEYEEYEEEGYEPEEEIWMKEEEEEEEEIIWEEEEMMEELEEDFEENWEYPEYPEAYEEEEEQDDWYVDDVTKPYDKDKMGFFATVTSAFSVTISERIGVTSMSANTKLGKVKVSGPRIVVGGGKSKYKTALYLDFTTTGSTQVTLCDPKLKSSPTLPNVSDIRLIGGSCTCEKAKPSSTSTLHNLIIASDANLLPGTTSGNYTVELTEVTCSSGSTPKILKTNGATVKFTIDSKVSSGSSMDHTGVQYSPQSIYAAEGWGTTTFDGYATSITTGSDNDSSQDGDNTQNEDEDGSGSSSESLPPTQTQDYSSSAKLIPYVSLFASHPIGTPYNGKISTSPIRFLLFSTPMSVDRMGVTSAYACVVGTKWNGVTEKSIDNNNEGDEGSGDSETSTVLSTSTTKQTLPRDCPASARQTLKLRSVVNEERSKNTNSFFLSGDIFSTLDLTSARGSRVLFVINGEGGKIRLYADLGSDKWDGCIINSYEGNINLDDGNNNNNDNNNDDDNDNNNGNNNNNPGDNNQGGNQGGDDNNGNNNGGNNNGSGDNQGGNNGDNNNGGSDNTNPDNPNTDGYEIKGMKTIITAFALMFLAILVL